MKAPEESGESENPSETEARPIVSKRSNDTLSIVCYWTRISLGLAMIALLVALLMPVREMQKKGAEPWFRHLSRLKGAIQAYNAAFDSPPMGRLADILPVLQLVEDPAGFERTHLTQMIDENFSDLAFSERPLANGIDPKHLVRFAAFGRNEDENVLYLITSDGCKYAIRLKSAKIPPAESLLDRPVDEIRNEYHVY